jgi:hypothetical protein
LFLAFLSAAWTSAPGQPQILGAEIVSQQATRPDDPFEFKALWLEGDSNMATSTTRPASGGTSNFTRTELNARAPTMRVT